MHSSYRTADRTTMVLISPNSLRGGRAPGFYALDSCFGDYYYFFSEQEQEQELPTRLLRLLRLLLLLLLLLLLRLLLLLLFGDVCAADQVKLG